MNTSSVKEHIESHVRTQFENEGSGHDWHHIHRVRALALNIAKQIPNANPEIVELIALMHECTDTKLFVSTADEGVEQMKHLLNDAGASKELIAQICEDVPKISFSNGMVPSSIEGKIVQDADRIEALGAIGIARTFAYGGHHNKLIYDPTHPLDKDHGEASSLHHFFEKLFLLRNTLNTQAAKDIAKDRDQFMHEFVNRFLQEWEARI